MNKALVLIDFQKEWLDPESDYFVGDITEVLIKVNNLIDYCREKDYKIIFTQHEEPNPTDAFASSSQGAELLPSIHRESKDVVITKNKISPFYHTTLEEELTGIKEVVVCGILTNLCVRSFIEGAYDRDLEITVVTDCCVARTPEIQDFTLKDLKETREEITFDTFVTLLNGNQL